MRVTAAVCLHDGAEFAGEALASILGQTVSPIEVLVIDDGSTDGAPDFLEAWLRDPRLKIIRRPHRGLGAARAEAVARAEGEWIAFLDQDDVWDPGKLERFLAAAASCPDAALIFSDARLMDEAGRPFGLWSERFDGTDLDLGPGAARVELLRRGCFIDVSATMIRRDAALEAGSFDPRLSYVEDLDLWLRMASRHRLFRIPEPLSSRRIHAGQFTQRRPETALSEQMALLRPRTTDLQLAPRVRIAVGDYLLGQHRECVRALLRRRDAVAALRVALGALRFPDRIVDAAHFTLLRRGTPRAVLGAVMPVVSVAVRAGHRAVRALERLRGHPARRPRVFIDGTPLGDERTGYFTFVSELVRSLLVDEPGAPEVEVAATSSGWAALKETVGPRISRLRWRRIRGQPRHWAAPYESLARPAVQALAAVSWAGLMAAGLLLRRPLLVLAGSIAAVLQILFLADRGLSRRLRRLGRGQRPPLVQKAFLRLHNARWAPRRPGGAGITEIVTWRGRFRFRRSRRIAFVPDLTTRIGPEWHTEANVREFDEFLAYALRHAHELATVSEHSRNDIVERLGVPRRRVLIAPSFIQPMFFSPERLLAVLPGYGLEPGYILSVCTAEPRKNLRRLVRAFESLAEDGRGGPVLALAGPAGWDEGFARVLASGAARARIRHLGFVPLEHLPTLYAQAGVFIYPSLYEGFGLPVLEAMASGALVAASRTSSLPEVLGDAGISFDPGSDRAVAEALERALHLAPAEAVELRARARRRAEEMVAAWKSNGPWPLVDDAAAECDESGRPSCG